MGRHGWAWTGLAVHQPSPYTRQLGAQLLKLLQPSSHCFFAALPPHSAVGVCCISQCLRMCNVPQGSPNKTPQHPWKYIVCMLAQRRRNLWTWRCTTESLQLGQTAETVLHLSATRYFFALAGRALSYKLKKLRSALPAYMVIGSAVLPVPRGPRLGAW